MSDTVKRRAAIKHVVKVFKDMGVELPDAAEIIALAEWLAEGSISVATALKGQQAALYREWEISQENEGEL